MERKISDGSSVGDTLESAERQLAMFGMAPIKKGKDDKPAPAVVPGAPPLPAELAYIWRWFGVLVMGEAANGMTFPRVTWTGLAAWQGVTGIRLLYWEVETMIRLSVERVAAYEEKAEIEKRKTPQQRQ